MGLYSLVPCGLRKRRIHNTVFYPLATPIVKDRVRERSASGGLRYFYHIIRTCQGTKRELLRALTVADNAVHDPEGKGSGRLFVCLEGGGTCKLTCFHHVAHGKKSLPARAVVCSRTLAAGNQLPGDSTNGQGTVKGKLTNTDTF